MEHYFEDIQWSKNEFDFENSSFVMRLFPVEMGLRLKDAALKGGCGLHVGVGAIAAFH